MADAYVAISGTWRKVNEQYIGVTGKWRTSVDSFVALAGTQRSAFSGVPTCTLSAGTNAGAPYSRLNYTYLVKGVWSKVEVILIGPTTADAVIQKTYPASGGTSTVSESAVLVTGLKPSSTYTVVVKSYNSVNKPTVLQQISVTTAAPPMIKNIALRGPITHNSGGVQWDSSTDVGNWETVNDSLGTSWQHGGDLPYIYYNGGLNPSSTYYVRSRSYVNGVWGSWSGQNYWTTAPAPYRKGFYELPRSWADTYQTGESGGQSAKWTNQDRASWYHGNGNAWASSRGTQKTCFFYDQNNSVFAELRNAFANGAGVANAWLLVERANVDAGNNSGVPVQMALHNTAHPGAPGNVSGNYGGHAMLKSGGENKSWFWHPVPQNWAQLIITQPHPYTGFMIGDTNDQNHYMAISKWAAVGTVRYEIA